MQYVKYRHHIHSPHRLSRLSYYLHTTMSRSLNESVIGFPSIRVITLSHTIYGRHFHLGDSVNIPSSPMQRLQSFVELEGTPYRFILVGQLMSFKVVEDSVRAFLFIKTVSSSELLGFEFGHYLSVNVGQPRSPSTFINMFTGQMVTLRNIEEVDRTDEAVQAQVIQFLLDVIL